MAQNVAEQLVSTIQKAGIKRIYAVTGDSLNRVNEAVLKNGKIDWIHVRHEETGAFAAAAEAQLTGEIACCAGSCGPGHVHLINGMYDANHSHAPVLVISSVIPSNEFGTDYFQATDSMKLFSDCSCYNQTATTPEQFPRLLQGALQATLSDKGVGVIGLTGDLAGMKAVDGQSSQYPFRTAERICPSADELAQLAEVLNKADKITLFCGIGAKDAHPEIIAVSNLLNAPVAYTFKSKLDIQYDNPNEVGLTGLLGMPSGYASMHDADVLVMLGTDFPYSNFLPEKNTIIQIDNKPERLGRRGKVDFGVCGDIKETLNQLIPLLEPKDNDNFLQAQIKHYKKVVKMLEHSAQERGKTDEISPEYVMSLVNKLAASDAIFTVDTGMTCVWGARYLHGNGKRKMLGSFNHGSMANAMPQAIGASLAYPDRQVVALCGDGGISMLLGDLATIVQYKLPIKLVVFNNRALGMVKLEMEVAGLMDWQTDMYNPDFAAVAMAMGMPGYNVHEPADVEPTLIRAFGTNGPVLVNVMTDPNALALPPKIEFAQMTGFAKAMAKLMIDGRTDEVMDTIKANMKHWKEIL